MFVIYFWNQRINKKEETLVGRNNVIINDVVPGSKKAVLTLADGSTINLDSAANGQLTIQSGIEGD